MCESAEPFSVQIQENSDVEAFESPGTVDISVFNNNGEAEYQDEEPILTAGLSWSKAIDEILEEESVAVDQAFDDASAKATDNQLAYGPPDTGTMAQIILIVTSLGSFRRQFFGSRKAQNFLDCKGIPYYLIDANRDVSKGAELQDQEFLDEWIQQDLLAKDEDNNVSSKFCIPQILIDGIAIGQEVHLQNLEEDGDLDWMIARAECPSCLEERDPSASSCPNCNVQFLELISEELVHHRRIQRYCRGQLYLTELPPIGHPNYSDIARAASLYEAQQGAQNTVATYEDLFGEPPPGGAE